MQSGGRERSGDEGKGCQSWAIGTKSFLESHRRMLVHMKKAASIELDQAVSAHVEAKRAYADANTDINLQSVWEAAEWIKKSRVELGLDRLQAEKP